MTRRLFIAIDLPGELKSAVGEVQEVMKGAIDGRWVKPGNLHLTLKFLGYVDEEKIAAIENSISNVIDNMASFNLTSSEIGAFPTLNRPRVIWVGLSDEERNCEKLQKSIDRALRGLGFEKEKRPFQPHVTLCRIRNQRRVDIKPPTVDQMSFEVSELFLFQSDLTPKGAVYTVLKKFPLKGYQNGERTDILQ